VVRGLLLDESVEGGGGDLEGGGGWHFDLLVLCCGAVGEVGFRI
jgi:hypothetical protein